MSLMTLSYSQKQKKFPLIQFLTNFATCALYRVAVSCFACRMIKHLQILRLVYQLTAAGSFNNNSKLSAYRCKTIFI